MIKPITFAIHTIGCKTNQAESDDIARQLVLKGAARLKFLMLSGWMMPVLDAACRCY